MAVGGGAEMKRAKRHRRAAMLAICRTWVRRAAEVFAHCLGVSVEDVLLRAKVMVTR